MRTRGNEALCIDTEPGRWQRLPMMFMITAVAILAAGLPAATASRRTLADWQKQSAALERSILERQREPATFMRIAAEGAAQERLRAGELIIQRGAGERGAGSPISIEGGAVHHWTGAVFVAGAKLAEVMRVMQDYDHLAQFYAPEVAGSKLLSHQGGDYAVEMRLHEQNVISVLLDTVSEIHYGALDADRVWSVSHMDRITDLSGTDHGLLWRMNTYWRFEQTRDGVFLECEVVTLTRSIPAGLGWLVQPFVSSVPRQSLEFTLQHTRAAIQTRKNQGGDDGDHAN